jgi:uncharacterized protein (TIGR03066 family)
MKKTIFAFIAACMAFVSCDLLDKVKDKDTIVGTWESTLIELVGKTTVTITPEEMTMILEFKEDGKFVQTNVYYAEDGSEDSRETESGTYKTEGTKLTMTVEGSDRVVDFTLDSDKLVIKSPVTETSYTQVTFARK